MKKGAFVVGIDLGTTHSAMAAALLEQPRLHLLSVPQLVAPGEVTEAELLPSFLYLPTEGEFAADECELPWGKPEYLVGTFARKHGAKNPNRLVASAKSWICHGGVNRRAAILPWSAPPEEPHLSPYGAQVAYLQHLERCWNNQYPTAPLAEQEVVVTVPASFDEAARTLTSEAAVQAGLGQVRLLEEPQAAFYDYLGSLAERGADSDKSTSQRAELAAARLILVVDMGGGTTDLTLLRVLPDSAQDQSGLPSIERIAVGGHLMLGGDNMDAALAFFALQKAGMDHPRDATVWSSLVQSARDAKERLLSTDPPADAVISYQGRGSRLIGNTKSITITREEAARVLLDGCFPRTGPGEVAQRSARAGLTTLGLPYTNDTAVPRHICTFLRRHAASAAQAGAQVHEGLPRPDLLLLNGGVFNAPAVVERLQEVLSAWYDGEPPALLQQTSLDTAVARGATRFGLALHGQGAVIRGGTAKSYYVGIEQEGRTRALCIAPRDTEADTRITVPDRLFELRLNEPVAFPLFTYTGDRVDAPGKLLEIADDNEELTPLAPLETILRGKKGTKVRESTVSVRLESFVDDAGNLHLSLVSVELPPRRWKLSFTVHASHSDSSRDSREEPADSQGAGAPGASFHEPASEQAAEPPHPEAGAAARTICSALSSGDEERVGGLRRELEDLLGPRGQWSASTCRVLADACLDVEPERGRSEAHELSWLRLLSWTLRPGFGCSGDRERMERLWQWHGAGPAAPNKSNWGEWWILWRRVAPGLSTHRQEALFAQVEPWLWRRGKPPQGPQPQGPVEMMRMVAALSRLSPREKAKAGALFLERAKKLGSYWPLGRVGARVPFYGPPQSVVDKSLAESWITLLLELDWTQAEGAAFAAASMAQLTGDATRDVDSDLRRQVVDRLTEVSAKERWIDMLLRPTPLDAGDAKSVLGDSLPAGLRLG